MRPPFSGKANVRILLVAVVAALAGAGASIYFDPTIAMRLASTEPGQRVLGAVLKSQAQAPPEGVIVTERGGIVANMVLADPDGVHIEVPKAWAGKVTLVNVWATWCAPCLEEMPDLQAFAGEQGTQGIQVVGIALDDAGAVRTFLRRLDITYPVLVDAPGPRDASVRLGNRAGVLPYSVLVSEQGQLLKTKIGPFEDRDAIKKWASL
ncbi:MAG: TlpA family protein disulfide reductase [Pseudomonadota bacterium]|nr:TlpA family protein disulfide reductase [Pseudomonadota bacterium]MDQ3159816.1 TlpA family protein disulfide reductase [Pseudomonadota bacterium]